MTITKRGGLLAALAAAGLTMGGAVWAETTLRIGTVLAPNDPMGQGLDKFAAEVKEATGGEVIVEVFHNSQLGDTTEMLDQARAGANVGTVTDVARLSSFVPSLAIMSASTPTSRPTNSPSRRLIWVGATNWPKRRAS